MLPASNFRRFVATLLVFGFATVGALGACQAPLEEKRGGPGEFCNGRDSDCRVGLICVQGVCKSANNAREHCRDVCAKFETCNVCEGVEDCKVPTERDACWQSCVKTVKNWGEEATQSYRDCYADAACEAFAGKQDPQNYCYQRLDLPDERADTCEQLRDDARGCFDGSSGSNVDEQFNDRCREFARTRSEEDWEVAVKCEQFDPETQCTEMLSCLNERFSLGDRKFPTDGGGGSEEEESDEDGEVDEDDSESDV